MEEHEWQREYWEEIVKESWSTIWNEAHKRYESLPEVTISAFEETSQAESSIEVSDQQSWTGRAPVITSSLADTPCSHLGVDGLLATLNQTLGTTYTFSNPRLYSLLHDCIKKNQDFGTAYGFLRPRWYTDCTDLVDVLRHCETRDMDMRRDVVHGNYIIHGSVPPRYIWDLYSNRVVPWWIAGIEISRIWAVSHAWVGEEGRVPVWTRINGRAWPVPLPKGMRLEHIRIELLKKGAEYVWQDVLCLRQAGGPREDLRKEEWKLDVPTIGNVYIWAERVVCYFSGLGLALSRNLDMTSDRSWFRRAWTLQEIKREYILGGETDEGLGEDARREFEGQLSALKEMQLGGIFATLREMQKRVSTNAVDRVAGLAYILFTESIPAYYEAQSEEDAWSALVDVLGVFYQNDLFLYPKPGDGSARWRPSWKQVMSEVLPDGKRAGWIHPESTCLSYYIERGEVRGLAKAYSEKQDREGELCVVDSTGVTHTFGIVARHQYLIPDGAYTLISSAFPWKPGSNWVVGHLQGNKFAKLSAFSISDGKAHQMLFNLSGVVEHDVKVDLL